MKKLFKSIVVALLSTLARAVVRRYSPHVVMVTGSVGKTSTKDAVAALLASKFFIRKSTKSFNSQFGVPFTILDVENPWRSPLHWLRVVKSALGLLMLPNHYPKMLVLEVGADKPGDLAHLLKIVTPDIVVVTALPEIPVHVEAYTAPEEVREEEFSPAYALGAAAPLIVPADDPYALAMALRTSARIISYGFAEEATVRVSGVEFYEEEVEGVRRVAGMRAKVHTQDEEGEIRVRGSVGRIQLLPTAAAVATAVAFTIPLADALKTLENYEPPAGRGRLLAGKNGSFIIDDSYNASPIAVEEALKNLKAFPAAGKRIAVLGDMLELGRYSAAEHERIGALARASCDLLVAVGIRARVFTAIAGKGAVMTFDNSRSAAVALPALIQPGDVILVKGSQSVRMERIVEKLLADSADARLLVRQEKSWKRKA